MDPLDPAKNGESCGSSKRRISSILKAPRKSIRFSDPEQQENVVECVKPVEKRNSRRVSFAPANNVLLFSNDTKNATPARSPLQDLMTTAAAAQNRVQVAVPEDGFQQITGMETLLNAPLHASQQKDKINFDFGDNYGEKTVMFSSDDAYMDMTHSQTINIANDADVSLRNFDIFPSSRKKFVMSTADDRSKDVTVNHSVNTKSGSVSLPSSRSMDLNAEVRNISSTVPSLDPGFENFLASLFKTSDPSSNPEITKTTPAAGESSSETNSSLAQMKTQSFGEDKENQAFTYLSAQMEKSLNVPNKTDNSSYGGQPCPKSDVSMDMTEAQTGCIQGYLDDVESFPKQELYPHLDHRRSLTVEKTKQQQSSTALASLTPKDKTTWKDSSVQRHVVDIDTPDEYSQKTTIFSAVDEFMDMTQSHTVNIASGSLAQNRTCGKMDSGLEQRRRETCGPPRLSANGLDSGFKDFLAGLSKTSAPGGNPEIARVIRPAAATSNDANICPYQLKSDIGKAKQSLTTTVAFKDSLYGGPSSPENDVSMDMTEAQTGHILGWGDDESHPHHELLRRGETTSGEKSSEAPRSYDSTSTEKSLKPSLKTLAGDLGGPQVQRVNFDAENDCRDRTVRFSADDACMDVTQSHTVSIATDFAAHDVYIEGSRLKPEKKLQLQHSQDMGSSNNKGMKTSSATPLKTRVDGHQVNFNAEDEGREKTVRFTLEEACMDVTQSHTVNIVTDLEMKRNVDFSSASGEKTVRFNANDAAMDVTQSHTVNIASAVELHSRQKIGTGLDPHSDQNVDFLSAPGEKTVRFNANDAAMDVTQSHTVNIVTDLEMHRNVDLSRPYREKTVGCNSNEAAMDMMQRHNVDFASGLNPQSGQHLDSLAASGEKTVRFNANDAAMDVTRSLTVNIASDVELHSHQNIATGLDPHSDQNVDFLPACKEKTARFKANDAAMDVTQSHTVNIASDVELHSRQNMDFLASSSKRSVRSTGNGGVVDVTQNLTVNIVPEFNSNSSQNVDFIPVCGENTLRLTANDAAMDVTQSHTTNIACDSETNSVFPRRNSNTLSFLENMHFSSSVKKTDSEMCLNENKFSSAHTLAPEFENAASETSGLAANPVGAKTVPANEAADPNNFLDQLKTKKPCIDAEKESLGLVSGPTENPANKTMAGCPEEAMMVAMTETRMDNIVDESPRGASSTQDMYPNSVDVFETKLASQKDNGSTNLDPEEITKPKGCLNSGETADKGEPEPREQTLPKSFNDDVDAASSQKSRRVSLANLHTKIRRLSHMINTAPDPTDTTSCTAPLPQHKQDMDKNSKDKTISLPVMESENNEENTQAQCLLDEEQTTSASATPFNLKTKQLMSRLSVGSFKPKLPQRGKPDDAKKITSIESTGNVTTNATKQLSNFNGDVSDIYDEELGSCEDMSEILDRKSPDRTNDKESPPLEFPMDEPLEANVSEEDLISLVHGKKRHLLAEENNTEDEKRWKASTEMATDVVDTGSSAPLTTDESSISHTASLRCEATFESTFKQSLFESQLEDYANDMQKKFDDGTITVLEFFKLFNIDFVIHNPRQSVLPERLLTDTDRTPMDSLKDRHIHHPRQMVYETNVHILAEKVEGLKERMRDLDKPLRIVNRPLWEEMSNSSEKELISFGAKLKERNNLFRKMSKVQSHEMKEVLYSDLVNANQEEQQRLRKTIEDADEMIKSLDDCITALQTELAAVEENGSEDIPSLKSSQIEMKKVTEALADNDRQISELEMQKTQNSKKLKRLKAETRDLESHVSMLHIVNEWKLGESRDNCTVYTFLHDTLHLQLTYDNGNVADNQSGRKISHISFKHQIDEGKSQSYACLVHKLLSNFTSGESAWVEKYPTSRYVPKLLHDVGLVVSRCRLLGEELRLLRMWGGLRLDILDIFCVNTHVHIVFSSLKKFSKFEVVFSVGLTNCLCVLHVESFKNLIGITEVQQIEEIVASFNPGRNFLTRIVKKIHENLLR